MTPVRGLLALVLLWTLAACQSLPFADEGVLPAPVVVADASAQRTELNARVYDAATGWIEDHYYDAAFNGHDWPSMRAGARDRTIAAPTEAEFYARLSDVVDALDDRHTAVTSPAARALEESVRTGQSSAGYGLSATRRGDRFFVTRVRPDGPAAVAGVQIGWRLITVNGSDAIRSVVPLEGRTDTFVFEDEQGVEQRLDITGRVFAPRSNQEMTRRGDGTLVLRFDAFDTLSAAWLAERMREAHDDPPRAIIVDLRDNPGGLASVLGEVTAHFFPGRTDFMLMKGRFINTLLHNKPAAMVWDGPLGVLVGPGSGSASELFAALVQEKDRGPVFGQNTAGAVIASRPVNLPDGGLLNLSLRIVLTGTERRLLEGVGVTPDVVVDPSLSDLRAGRDPVLEAAAAALLQP